MHKKEMREVDIDAAVAKSGESLTWIDSLLEEGVGRREEGGLAWHTLVRQLLGSDVLGSHSVEQSLEYLLVTRETILGGEEGLGEERRVAVVRCAGDLASAYVRVAGGEVVVEEVRVRSDEAERRGELGEALEEQQLVTILSVMKGDEWRGSVRREVGFLLKLGDWQGVLAKILAFSLYRSSYWLVNTATIGNIILSFSSNNRETESCTF